MPTGERLASERNGSRPEAACQHAPTIRVSSIFLNGPLFWCDPPTPLSGHQWCATTADHPTEAAVRAAPSVVSRECEVGPGWRRRESTLVPCSENHAVEGGPARGAGRQHKGNALTSGHGYTGWSVDAAAFTGHSFFISGCSSAILRRVRGCHSLIQARDLGGEPPANDQTRRRGRPPRRPFARELAAFRRLV